MNEQIAVKRPGATVCLLVVIGVWVMSLDSLFAQNGSVARAQFTTNVTNREPVDSVSEISNETKKVHFFTELTNMTGSAVVHRWNYKNAVAAEVSFNVKGPRWRVYSSKQIADWMTGSWVVEIVVDGKPLEEAYTLSVIDDGLAPQINSRVTATDTPPELPAEIVSLQELFPNSKVVSLMTDGDVDACPPATQFKWQRVSANHWQYQLADVRIPVHLGSDSQTPSKSSVAEDCIHQTRHQMNQASKELIIEHTSSCTSSRLPVLSLTSLKREGDNLDLVIFSDTMSHCRYGLSVQ